MTLGVALAAEKTDNSIDNLIAQTGQAAAAGIRSVWFSQQLENDAVSVAALAGRAVPEVAVGTSVVPIFPRNPLVLGGQAQTAQAATHGRFSLGIGLGAKTILEPTYGTPYPPPVRHLREYLTVLRQMFSGEQVAFDGEILNLHPAWPTGLPGSGPIPLLVAAMGPQALRVTGELADGTLPYLAGPRAIAQEIVPVITKAAEAAGRPSPRIIAFISAVVTDDVDAVREIAAGQLAFYDKIPSYQRIIEAEGVAGAAELAVIGDEEFVAAAVQRYYDAGATEVVVTQAGIRSTEDRLRTWQLLGELA
jgi:F420-dependent oxidoreductase-like protein